MNKKLFCPSIVLLYCLGSALFVVSENMDETMDLMDGDIMGIAPSLLQHDAGSDTASNDYRWPQNTVPYVFQQGYPQDLRRLFAQAINHISQRTCIRFVPRTNQKDYIQVIAGLGCYSYVGRINKGSQDVSLPYGCNVLGIFVHELLHAVGFRHEQARADRDRFVNINWQNIKPLQRHNFDRYQVDMRTPYDYRSVMHYSRNAFSSNGRETITPRKGNAHIGQRDGMSYGDVLEVNKLFCRNRQKK